MGGLSAAFTAIGGGFRDIFSARLGGLALICVVLAFGITVGVAWAAFRYGLPLIPDAQGWLGWLYEAGTFLAGAGIVVLSVVLAPAVSMFLGGVLFDVAAERVEKQVFAGDPPGRMVPVHEGVFNGLRIALPALVLNLISLPLLFVPVVNLVWFLGLNGFLMGREYASLAAVRHMQWGDVKALRARAPMAVFLVGLVCSIVPFVAPLLGASAMTRLVKALSANNRSERG